MLAKGLAPTVMELDALVREGKRLFRGEGMTEEDIAAFALFLRAAEGGHGEAQWLVSECYKKRTRHSLRRASSLGVVGKVGGARIRSIAVSLGEVFAGAH